MKDIFSLCLIFLMLCFTFSTCVGVICATIDIIRSKKRYTVEASADVIPDDYFTKDSVSFDSSESDSSDHKKVIE